MLDEYESFSARELVRQCGVLDFKYMPKRWVGDREYGAAIPFIDEMNDDRHKREQELFSFSRPFELLEMNPLYPYILDEIKRLIRQDHRRLFLPENSKVLSYLSNVVSDEIYEYEIGDYPAVEALAFAVIEILRWANYRPPRQRYKRPRSPMA